MNLAGLQTAWNIFFLQFVSFSVNITYFEFSEKFLQRFCWAVSVNITYFGSSFKLQKISIKRISISFLPTYPPHLMTSIGGDIMVQSPWDFVGQPLLLNTRRCLESWLYLGRNGKSICLCSLLDHFQPL